MRVLSLIRAVFFPSEETFSVILTEMDRRTDSLLKSNKWIFKFHSHAMLEEEATSLRLPCTH